MAVNMSHRWHKGIKVANQVSFRKRYYLGLFGGESGENECVRGILLVLAGFERGRRGP